MNNLRFGLSESILTQMRDVIAKYPEIDRALIFGSRAKGNHRDDSDIDLAILAPIMSDETFAQLWNQLDALPLVFKLDVVHWDRLGNEALKRACLETGEDLRIAKLN
jgi:proline iminopeptidase